jgi:hypothetical protein
MENDNNKKIGFEVQQDPEGNKIVFDKRSKLRKYTTRITILATLFAIASIAIMFAKVFGAFFIIIAFFIVAAIIMLPILCTVFLILISDEFRKWVGDTWGFFESIVDVANNLDKISPIYAFVAYPALGLLGFVLFLSMIGMYKEKKGYIGTIIFTVILIIILAILTFFYVKNGNSIIL